MKTNVNLNDFRAAFKSLRPANFSYYGLEALYNWIENFEEDTGKETELDVIALCCNFTEFEDVDDFLKEHYTDIDRSDFDNDEDYYEAVKEEIKEDTTFIDINSENFIIQDY